MSELESESQAQPRPSAGLRALSGILLSAGPLIAGVQGNSLWCVPALVGIFVLYKWWTGRALWRQHIAERGSAALPAMLAATVVVQGFVVTLLYLAGRMASGSLRDADQALPFRWLDLATPLALAFLAAAMTEWALVAEKRGESPRPSL